MNTTKKAQHTGGEWSIYKIQKSDDFGIEVNGGKKVICSPCIFKESDARLIASAPLMLKALEAVLNMGDEYEAEKLVREAIKQARGE